MVKLVFNIIDGSLMLWFCLSLIHFVINKQVWSEDLWRADGTGYTKGSTKDIRRRMLYHMLLAGGGLLHMIQH